MTEVLTEVRPRSDVFYGVGVVSTGGGLVPDGGEVSTGGVVSVGGGVVSGGVVVPPVPVVPPPLPVPVVVPVSGGGVGVMVVTVGSLGGNSLGTVLPGTAS